MGGVWSDTASNITSIQLTGTANGIGVGTRIIILKGNALAVGTSPGTTGAWKRVGSSVLGADAASVTFTSGISGNTAICYYISTAVKAGASAVSNTNISLNSDVTNYGYQIF
jgi:hypothetical protein